jgi:hypothetical protein
MLLARLVYIHILCCIQPHSDFILFFYIKLQQYQAKNMECSDINYCMNCDHDPDVGCSPIKNYPLIRVSEFGTAHGDYQIMAEIYARGPVSAAINAECIETYSGGINMYGK